MTTQDLFRCIGDLSDTMIEEAADIRRKKRWLPIAALAACAVLAISIPLAVRNLGYKSAADAETPTTESPASDEKPAENGISPAETDSAVGATESPREPEASGGWEDSDPIAARILSTEIGGLRLGMKREDVQAMLGEPDSVSNTGEIQREDGVWEVCWFYNTSGSADVQYDLRLRFTNTGMRDGSGSVLSEVWTQSPCDWTLDTGIGIGSPQEAVEAAYPDAVWTHETMIENDQEIPYDLYELTSIIVCRNNKIDIRRVRIRIYHSKYRNTQTIRFTHSNMLFHYIDNKKSRRKTGQISNTAQRLFKFSTLTSHLQFFTFRQIVESPVFSHFIDSSHFLNSLTNRREVSQHTTRPTFNNVRHIYSSSFISDYLFSLFFSRYKKHLFT